MRIKNNNETVKISEAFHLLAAASIEATRLSNVLKENPNDDQAKREYGLQLDLLRTLAETLERGAPNESELKILDAALKNVENDMVTVQSADEDRLLEASMQEFLNLENHSNVVTPTSAPPTTSSSTTDIDDVVENVVRQQSTQQFDNDIAPGDDLLRRSQEIQQFPALHQLASKSKRHPSLFKELYAAMSLGHSPFDRNKQFSLNTNTCVNMFVKEIKRYAVGRKN